MAEILAPVVPPTQALVDDMSNAASSGNPAMVRAVIPAAAGTTMAQDVQNSANFMENRVRSVNNVVDASNEKGGIQTPEGRLEAAKKIEQEYKSLQPGTSWLKAVGAAFMGVPDAWKLATTGRTESKYQYDKFGNGAIVFYNQNNPNMPAYAIDATTNQPIDKKSFGERGFGLYADAASSPFAQASAEINKSRRLSLEDSTGKANINSAVYGEIGNNAKAIQDTFEKLSSKGYGLTNTQLNEINSVTSKVLQSESLISDSMNTLRSSQDVDARRNALENMKGAFGKAGGDLLPFTVGTDGKIVDSSGKSITSTLFDQKVREALSKSSLSVQYNQAREQLINSTVFKNLPTTELKGELINALNLIEANHRLMNDLKTSEKELPFLATSIPMKLGDPFQVGIVSTLMDQYKAEAAQKFQQFLLQERKNFTDEKPPAVGEIENAFEKKILPELRNKYGNLIREAQSRVYPEGPKKESLISGTIDNKSVTLPPPNQAKPPSASTTRQSAPTTTQPAPNRPPAQRPTHESNILNLLNNRQTGR